MQPTHTTRPLAVYGRVSARKDREDESYHSPTEQQAKARAYAESKGYTTDGWFFDEDVSGGVHPEKRPEMARLLEAVRSGEVGGIVAGWLDRLSREPSHGEWLIKEVTKHGGVVLAPDIPEDITSAAGRMTFGQLLLVARFIRDTARERFTLSKIGSIRSGVPVSQAPVGYRRIMDGPSGDPKDRRLELDPETAPVVREMFEKRAQGVSRDQLHKLLVERTGRSWAREAVRVILTNPIYKTGRLRYQLDKQDESSWIESDWQAEPVVTEATWQAAQIEPLRKPQRSKDPNNPWLLTGFAKDTETGYNLKPHQQGAHKPNGPYRYYVGDRNGSKTRASAPKLEAWVLEQLLTFGGTQLKTVESGPKLGPLEAAVEEARVRFETFNTPETEDAYGPELFRAEIKKRRLTYESALAALGRALADGATASTTELEDLKGKWETMTVLARKQLLGRWIAYVRVGGKTPDEWEIVWR